MFRKGRKKSGGRKKGTPNIISRNAKEVFIQVFNEIGGVEKFKQWVLTDINTMTEFYRLYSKLLPLDIGDGGGLNVVIRQYAKPRSWKKDKKNG
jgi:hypothetical protein